MKGAHRSCSHWHGLGAVWKSRATGQGRGCHFGGSKGSISKQREAREPLENSLFSFHAPPGVCLSPSPGPSPHGPCRRPWLQSTAPAATPQPSETLQPTDHPVIHSLL